MSPVVDIVVEKADRTHKRTIKVNGAIWAYAWKHSHGPRGYSYTFQDAFLRGIYRPNPKKSAGYRPIEWKVWSDKIAQKPLERGVTVKPIEERLITEIQAMINARSLVSPDVARAEIEERRKRLEEAEAQMQAERDAEFRKRAEQCVGDIDIDGTLVIERIIAAMKWAQTQ